MELSAHEAKQSKTFYETLQSSPTLDLRDKRGKRHDISLVLMGIMVSLFRNREGNLSSIHRSMTNMHTHLLEALDIDNQYVMKVVSRSHLPVLLSKVCVDTFGNLVFDHFGIVLTESEKTWFSVDGKEMRGTILSGDTRGEAIVQAVHQESKIAYCQGYYNGSKESEKGVVTELLRQTGLAKQGITLDALHFSPITLSCIAQLGGHYVVGLKENQEEIYKDMQQLFNLKNVDYQYFNKEKGHGRIETRQYSIMDVRKEYFDKRWRFAQLSTVIQAKRTRTELKTGKYSDETSYYMSNCIIANTDQAKQIYGRIRNHWAIETNNHIRDVRDVTLKEDALQTIFKTVAQPISLMRTLIINVLKKEKIKNVAKILDDFADDFNLLIQFFKNVKIL